MSKMKPEAPLGVRLGSMVLQKDAVLELVATLTDRCAFLEGLANQASSASTKAGLLAEAEIVRDMLAEIQMVFVL